MNPVLVVDWKTVRQYPPYHHMSAYGERKRLEREPVRYLVGSILGLVLVSVLLCLAIALFILPGGGGNWSFRYPRGTPEEAARAAVCPTSGEPVEFQVHDTLGQGDRALITYTAKCPPEEDSLPELEGSRSGFILLSKRLFGWGEEYGVGYCGVATGDDGVGRLLSYLPGGRREGRGRYGYVCGEVLSPEKVATVETVFDNGEVLRHETTGGIYAFYAEDTNGPCEVRALDARGKVLERHILSAEQIPRELSESEARDIGWNGISLASKETCAKL